MGTARFIVAQTFRVYEPLLAAAVYYICLTFIITRVFRYPGGLSEQGPAGAGADRRGIADRGRLRPAARCLRRWIAAPYLL